MRINYKKLNPLGFHLLKLLQDKNIRNIILYGGSSSGKTYSVAQIILILTIFEGSNTLVMRKVGAAIKDSVYQDFKTAATQLKISKYFKFVDGNKTIRCLTNDGRIVFKGLDDSEKIKGLSSFKRIVLDEWSEFFHSDYKQIRLRLRAQEGQQLIYTFNPIKETHWIKKEVIDKQKWHDYSMRVVLDGKMLPEELTQVKSIKINEPLVMTHYRTGEIIEHPADTVMIQTTYLNNFWVVGSPDGTYGYYDEQCIATFEQDRILDPDYYNVYALGEWGVIRSGSEFFSSFNRANHVTKVDYDHKHPVHISLDNNVLPYISCTYWQISYEGGIHIRQIGETCSESPNNTVRKAAKQVAGYLKELGVDKVFVHGDASTRNASTMDEAKRSWLDLYIDTLVQEGIEVVDCVGNQNPPVAMSGEFINAIYEGMIEDVDLVIGDNCPVAIEDYQSVQKDSNGAILKTRVKNKTTKQTYEEYGHLSDTKRYLICDILKEMFIKFSNRRKRNLYAGEGALKYYNPDGTFVYNADFMYIMPNVNGKFGMVHGKRCAQQWNIIHAELCETVSTDEIMKHILSCSPEDVVIECGPSYYPFVKDLRNELPGVRVAKEGADIDKRIAATSDYVKNHILFNERFIVEREDYGAFVFNMLDYRKDGAHKEASAVLSGFARLAIKSYLTPELA